MKKDSIAKTFAVAAGLCIICSIIVSATATSLKEKQLENKLVDKQLNVLCAAGIIESGVNPGNAKVKELFGKVKQVVVDLNSGKALDDADPMSVSPTDVLTMTPEMNIAGLDKNKRPNKVVAYQAEKDNAKILILPIYGKGLWSTIYGFIALKDDLNTIVNITFYDHGETPGLGGEISNPAWTAKWTDKQICDASEQPVVAIIKGTVALDDKEGKYKIDGISGATLTGNGVNNTVRFWLGKNGFGPYLKNLKKDK